MIPHRAIFNNYSGGYHTPLNDIESNK